jgi:hypothetical protein
MLHKYEKSKTINVARATCSSFFERFKNNILKFQTKLKINVDIEFVGFYQREFFLTQNTFYSKLCKNNKICRV